MTAYIYINHVILRTAGAKGPVVRVALEDGTFREGNTVIINGPSVVRYRREGLPEPMDRRVTAWVEARSEDVWILQ